MLLNTFVWGLSAPEKSESPLSSRALLLKSAEYRAKPRDDDNYFTMFGRKISASKIARRISLVPTQARLDAPTDDLVLHDPKFWQIPNIWWRHHLKENGNSFSRAASAYIKTMLWKLSSLLKLTLGIWSENQIEQFQIRYRSKFMSFSDEMNEEHEAMLRAVGQQQSSVWLFMPYLGAFLSKVGDGFNETPLFVEDGTSIRALKSAQEVHAAFTKTQKETEAALPSGSEHETFSRRKRDGRRGAESANDNRDREMPTTVVSSSSRGASQEMRRAETVRPTRNRKAATTASGDDGGTQIVEVRRQSRDGSSRASRRNPYHSDGPSFSFAPMPATWTRVPSRSRPGEFNYKNINTGEVSTIHPLHPVFLQKRAKRLRDAKKPHDTKVDRLKESRSSGEPPNEQSERQAAKSQVKTSAKPNRESSKSRSRRKQQGAEGKHAASTPQRSRRKNGKSASASSPERTPHASSSVGRRKHSSLHEAARTEAEIERQEAVDGGSSRPQQRIKRSARKDEGPSEDGRRPKENSTSHAHGTRREQSRAKGHSRSANSRRAAGSSSSARNEAGRDAAHVNGGAPPGIVVDNDDGTRSGGAPHTKLRVQASKFPIGDFLDLIKWGNSVRFAGVFKKNGVVNLRALLDLDDAQYSILIKKVKRSRNRASEKTLELIEALDEMRLDGFSFLHLEDEEDTQLEEPDEGIYEIIHNQVDGQSSSLSFQESKLYWIIDIKRPPGQRAHGGEGMLLWFSNDSVIGSADRIAEESSASVRFMEYKKTGSNLGENQHGTPVQALEAHYRFDFNTLSKVVQFGTTYAGRPGDALPSYDAPLFVPKTQDGAGNDAFTCVLCLSCPRGTTPNFKLRAAYTEETPLLGLERDLKRRLRWFLHVSLIVAIVIVVLATGESKRAGVYL